MAKAALNMLTRTSATELALNYRIYMNSVDTGWINDENPIMKANRIAKENKFQTPIDEIDAAARIVDPIFSSVIENEQQSKLSSHHDNLDNNDQKTKKQKTKKYQPIYGKFLKDYRETEW